MLSAPELPHSYPFRFVDTVLTPAGTGFGQGSVSARLTANGRGAMGAGLGSAVLLAEMLAQAALLLQGGDAGVGRRGFLAGIDGFEVTRLPEAGESLEVDVRLTARFGPVIKFEGEVRSGSETVARGAILVRQGGLAGTGPADLHPPSDRE
jgi:3-hydroxymyristoyl/3-hydroxydecanoyl-(acyl carrier protein) dehydratase